jgi:hypothetical protein
MGALIGLKNIVFSSSSFLVPTEASLFRDFRRIITGIHRKDVVNILDMIRLNQLVGSMYFVVLENLGKASL